MRFSAYVLFVSLWSVVVYAPVAHWVWGGWLATMGARDFGGGTVVHVNAGVAALVAAFVVGRRRSYASTLPVPHNIPFVLLGAGLLCRLTNEVRYNHADYKGLFQRSGRDPAASPRET